jgi:hypothetical protein
VGNPCSRKQSFRWATNYLKPFLHQCARIRHIGLS